ncbi:MAG: glycoside hydrolase family 20 zincin-like fold domain-containing protein, partial [Kiritimatiellia bacterium]
MRRLLAIASALAASVAAADVLDDNRVTYGNDNAGYRRLHVGYPGAGGTHVDAAGYERMRTVYLQELAARTAARPTDAALALEYGEALMFKGDFAAAEPILVRALAQAKVPAPVLAGLLYRAAECRLVAGDKAACRAQLERLVALKGVTHWRKREWAKWARDALVVLQGDDAAMDALGLPQTRTARAYPEPHKVRYGETMVPLRDIRLSCAGVAEDDARIRLLKTRLRRMGLSASADAGTYPLSIACTPEAPVAQREGYSLSVTDGGARIEARDPQGVLWGVVSLLQLIDYEAKTIRPAEIEDWSDTAARGYLGEYWAGCAEYTVFQKLNSVVLRIIPTRAEFVSPLNRLQIETTCRQFRELGLTLYCGINDVTRYPPHLPFCWPETMDYIVAVCKRYAALGAGVYFPHDDERYPLPPPDLEAYGTASAIDA